MILAISAPSGAGKNTVISHVQKHDPKIQFAVSHTTRDLREGEINGVHYHQVTDEKFHKMIGEGKFIEFAVVHGKLYGTSVSEIEKGLNKDADLILDIDVKGVSHLKTRLGKMVNSLFILPPSREALENRIRRRSGGESEHEIALRLENAHVEMSQVGKYDFWIVNDDLEKCVEKVITLIQCLRDRESPDRMKYKHPKELENVLDTFLKL